MTIYLNLSITYILCTIYYQNPKLHDKIASISFMSSFITCVHCPYSVLPPLLIFCFSFCHVHLFKWEKTVFLFIHVLMDNQVGSIFFFLISNKATVNMGAVMPMAGYVDLQVQPRSNTAESAMAVLVCSPPTMNKGYFLSSCLQHLFSRFVDDRQSF